VAYFSEISPHVTNSCCRERETSVVAAVLMKSIGPRHLAQFEFTQQRKRFHGVKVLMS